MKRLLLFFRGNTFRLVAWATPQGVAHITVYLRHSHIYSVNPSILDYREDTFRCATFWRCGPFKRGGNGVRQTSGSRVH